MRMLVADDDPVLRFALEGQLEDWGFEVECESDGESALRRLSQPSPPRIALLDWSMPGMSGIEVCQRVRESGQSEADYVYIIMLTGRSHEDSLIQALEAGADDFVAKPYHVDELKMRLRAARRLIEHQTYLRDIAILDPLTGLLNRRGMAWAFRAECNRSVRSGYALAVIAIDLDHFKRINDSFGHSAGDHVLATAAQRIQASIRDFDSAIRSGGEEFVVLCPQTTTEDALTIAERVRHAFEVEPFEIPMHGTARITVSVGVSGSDGGSPPDAEALLRDSDAALYAAKESGRNRVHRASRAEDRPSERSTP